MDPDEIQILISVFKSCIQTPFLWKESRKMLILIFTINADIYILINVRIYLVMLNHMPHIYDVTSTEPIGRVVKVLA